MSKIIKLVPKTQPSQTAPVDDIAACDAILEFSKGKLDSVVVIGERDGDFFLATKNNSVEHIVYALENMKQRVLLGEFSEE